MTTDLTTQPSTKDAGIGTRRIAALAGAAAIGLAVYQVSTSGPPQGATYDSVSDYGREVLFLTYLLATNVAVLSARQRGWAPNRPAILVVGGYALITTGVSIGLALREELSWFFALAGPGLIASTAGFVAWAIWSRRNDVMPMWASTLLGIGGALAIIFSELGTSVLIGAFWLSVARGGIEDARDERPGRARARVSAHSRR